MPYSKDKKSEKNFVYKWVKKIQCINYKGGKCEKCGELSPFKMSFHHTNPNEKDFQISSYSLKKNWGDLKTELDKCQMLCLNCHHELHCNVEMFKKFEKEILEKAKQDICQEETKITDELLIEDLKAGLSQRQIAKKHNMGKTTIQYRIRQLIKKNKIDQSICKTAPKQP